VVKSSPRAGVKFCRDRSDREGRKAYYDDVKSRMDKYGRPPRYCKIFPALIPFIRETENIAREKQAHTELADPISGLIPLSSYLSHDFSRYPLDEPIKNVKINGVQGMYDLTVRLTRNRNLTLRDIGLEPAHTPAFGTGCVNNDYSRLSVTAPRMWLFATTSPNGPDNGRVTDTLSIV
jgi:alkanesulfonate monooxygenase SsuD/methylene tetrahydromethanopterin reductase-like flavin-dependent oxidoreductase (luciferase family)